MVSCRQCSRHTASRQSVKLRTAGIVSRTASQRASSTTRRFRDLHVGEHPHIVVGMTTERRADTAKSDHESFAWWKIAAVWTVPALLSTVETVMFARNSG